MGAVRVNLGGVNEGMNDFTFVVGPEEIGLEEENAVYRKPVNVSLRIARTGLLLTMNSTIHTWVDRVCCRCSSEFTEEFDAEFMEVGRIDGERIRLVDDPCNRGFEYLENANGSFSVDPLIREAILVYSPMQPLCSPDCRGLCPVCGVDRNDGECGCKKEEGHPAWEALRNLKDSKKRD